MYFVLCQGGKLKCSFLHFRANFLRKGNFYVNCEKYFPKEYGHDPLCVSGETPKTSYDFLFFPRNNYFHQ